MGDKSDDKSGHFLEGGRYRLVVVGHCGAPKQGDRDFLLLVPSVLYSASPTLEEGLVEGCSSRNANQYPAIPDSLED